MFFLLYKHTDNSVFDDFPKISEDQTSVPECFPRISEDCQRILRKIQRCFDATPMNLSTIIFMRQT